MDVRPQAEIPLAVRQELSQWSEHFDQLTETLGARFPRREAREHARAYLQGLLGPARRKNGWQLAEAAGDATPLAIQHLLNRAKWDAEAVRDDLRDYVIEHLGEREAVLVLDETGFLKKGTHSAGVQRQYSGTAGRIENCQVAVFLAYVSSHGRAFIDRALYLPRSWTDDPERCKAAGIARDPAFATKPQLGRRMLERAIAAGVPFRWITGDEVYGDDRRLRGWLEQHDHAYVLAIGSNQYLMRQNVRQQRADTIAKEIAPSDWHRLSAGDGAKGARLYDWAWLPMLSWMTSLQRGLLVRRSLTERRELAYYAVYAPSNTPLEALVEVAGRRWAIEEGFEASKQLVGLDQYEVRTFTGWYRHITLALLAHAYLAVMRAKAIEIDLKKGGAHEGAPHQPSSLQAYKAKRGCCH